MATTKKHTLFTIYLGIVSFIAFIWLAISIIVFAHKIISTKIITDEEYIAQNHRELDRCENNILVDYPKYIDIKNNIEENIETKKTKEELKIEKEECIKKTKERLILQRNIDKKETMILSWLRGVILLIIFPIHFIYFKKYSK